MTPMLDVVFILLIFFIVTATFTKEFAIGVEPPPPSVKAEAPRPAIIVEIDYDDLVRVDGRLSDPIAIRANLERLKAENPDTALIIQAHPDARTQMVVRVRDAAASAKIESVNVALTDI